MTSHGQDLRVQGPTAGRFLDGQVGWVGGQLDAQRGALIRKATVGRDQESGNGLVVPAWQVDPEGSFDLVDVDAAQLGSTLPNWIRASSPAGRP